MDGYFGFGIQAIGRCRCFCRRLRGRPGAADFGFILCQSFQQTLVFAPQPMAGLLLPVDEIQQLFDRDLPEERASAKLSQIYTHGQDAHDHSARICPRAGVALAGQSPKAKGDCPAPPHRSDSRGWSWLAVRNDGANAKG